ncbi:hypothetical protein I79_003693 [Cricetulus griseus]|uniref:Uncharacterized protein n=1 Tax=Cricetulus griseus TaxID=10029 RepID=G3H0M9_CRIGR|nr:hypothetical protein I79_003693 [Cricetulus griseus]
MWNSVTGIPTSPSVSASVNGCGPSPTHLYKHTDICYTHTYRNLLSMKMTIRFFVEQRDIWESQRNDYQRGTFSEKGQEASAAQIDRM